MIGNKAVVKQTMFCKQNLCAAKRKIIPPQRKHRRHLEYHRTCRANKLIKWLHHSWKLKNQRLLQEQRHVQAQKCAIDNLTANVWPKRGQSISSILWNSCVKLARHMPVRYRTQEHHIHRIPWKVGRQRRVWIAQRQFVVKQLSGLSSHCRWNEPSHRFFAVANQMKGRNDLGPLERNTKTGVRFKHGFNSCNLIVTYCFK